MIFGSVCSGIEAASCAWSPLGWGCAFTAEIDPFASAVLAYRWPRTQNLGDINDYESWPACSIDTLIGGTPCQSFSVAGFRNGMADPRGQLTKRFLNIAGRYSPRWIVWENVPGVLSSDGGRAFGSFLGGLAKLGYGFAYRILDAQFFGLAQRRKRVFVVGHSGGIWQRAAAVLFDSTSLRGNPPPGRESRQDISPTISARTEGGGGLGTDYDCDGGLIAHTLRADGFDASEDGTGRGTPIVAETLRSHPRPGSNSLGNVVAFSAKDHGADVGHLSPTLRAGGHNGSHANGGCMPAVAFQEAQTGVREYASAGTLRANGPGHDPVGTRIMEGMNIRRVTPRECERLQGFPDDYTLVPYRGKPAFDGPRYKSLGNSMAVPVIRWIGKRIQIVDSL